MTYFDADSAKRSLKAPAITAIVVMAIALAGCESTGSILGGGDSSTAPQIATPQPAPVQQPLRKVVLAPVIGAPDAVSRQLSTQLGTAAGQQRFELLQDRDARGEFTLRGYMVAARDKAGTKVSYIWDVADASGKRVHRITGEEVAAAAPNARDPWAAVTPAVMQTIADKTAAQLGAWLPNQPAGAVPTAGAAQPVAAAGAGAGGVPPAPQATPVAAAQPAASNTQTASLPANGGPASQAPVVTGAPGDGNAALAEALQRELVRQGVSLADASGTYRVEGKVVVGAARDGKQPIQIDWRVRDPQGKSLGTVSQKNEIPPGSLDGQWGKTADAAAAAAAQGIIKLLPQARSTN